MDKTPAPGVVPGRRPGCGFWRDALEFFLGKFSQMARFLGAVPPTPPGFLPGLGGGGAPPPLPPQPHAAKAAAAPARPSRAMPWAAVTAVVLGSAVAYCAVADPAGEWPAAPVPPPPLPTGYGGLCGSVAGSFH